jgi:type IV secretory pathway VirB6-like protein
VLELFFTNFFNFHRIAVRPFEFLGQQKKTGRKFQFNITKTDTAHNIPLGTFLADAAEGSHKIFTKHKTILRAVI